MSWRIITFLFLIGIIGAFTSTNSAEAVTVNSGDKVQIEFMGENETRVISGRNVEITGELNGDVYVFAGSLISKAIIHGDLILFAGEALITGDILGNLRGAAVNLTINNKVKNVTVVAGKLTVDEKTSAQDLFAAASQLTINGVVRNANLAGDTIFFNAIASEHVKLLAREQVEFYPSTSISGSLFVKSKKKPAGFDSINVLGMRNFEEPRKQRPIDTMFGLVIDIFSLLAVIYVLWGLPRIRSQIITFHASLKSVLLPLLWAALIPIILILLLITVIGVPLAVLLGILTVIGLLITKASGIIYLSNTIATTRGMNSHVTLILLSILAILLGEIPFIGWIFPVALGILGWAIVVHLFQTTVK